MLAIIDTETTGLRLHPDAPLAKQPRCIEFAAVILSTVNGQLLESYEFLICPDEPLPDEIVKITGITDAMLVGQPSFVERLPKLRGILGQASCVLAHNLPFDKGILMGEMARLPGEMALPWPGKELCSVGLYREQWGRNPKLTELYEATLGKPLAQTHRAMSDVAALVEIVQAEELWRLV